MKFATLSHYFEKIEQTPSRLEMTRILSELFKRTSDEEIDKVAYLLQGRVAPNYETKEFGLAERLLLKSFIGAFSLNEKEVRAQFKKIGDIGKIAQEYRTHAHTLFQSSKDLSVKEVYEQLFRLTNLEGTGSQEQKLSIVAQLLEQLDPLSVRYLMRIVSGDLRLGFSDMTVLDSYSWMLTGDKTLRKEIEAVYNVKPDIGLLGVALKRHGKSSLHKPLPEPGVPVLMARAERVSSSEEILTKSTPIAVESKYDGLRLQIHLQKNGEVRIYSRNLENVAQMFPDLVAAVKKEFKAGAAIIEGEAIGYNEKSGKYLPFQETMQRKRKYDIAQMSIKIPLRLFLFDLLFVDGVSYLGKAYTERKEALRKHVAKNAHTLVVTHEEITDKPEKIEFLFTEAIHEGFEGIMAKKLAGIYEAGARGWNWMKFKHSYNSSLSDTVDLVIMGYDYGKGKRTTFGIGAFLVGVYDGKKEKFLTVAKIGTGLTDEEWRSIRKRADEKETKVKPEEYEVNKLMFVDVWIKPSIVVEIRADELTKSTMHTAGLALRFPRLERFRDDKSPRDISTTEEIQKLFSSQKHASV